MSKQSSIHRKEVYHDIYHQFYQENKDTVKYLQHDNDHNSVLISWRTVVPLSPTKATAGGRLALQNLVIALLNHIPCAMLP